MIDFVALSVVLGIAFIIILIIAIYKEYKIDTLKDEVDSLLVSNQSYKSEALRVSKLCSHKDLKINRLQEKISDLEVNLEELDNQYKFDKAQHLRISSEKEEFISQLHEMNSKLSDQVIKYKRLQAQLVSSYKLMQDNLKSNGTITT